MNQRYKEKPKIADKNNTSSWRLPFCETCKRSFKPLGIANHRAMHRRNKQDCTIIMSNYIRKTWRYSGDKMVINLDSGAIKKVVVINTGSG